MEEFALAYDKMMKGAQEHIILVLIEDIPAEMMSSELQHYLRTHNYIDGRNYAQHTDAVRNKILRAMPATPFKQLLAMV